MGVSLASGRAVVYSRGRSLSHYTTLPTPETLGNAHISDIEQVQNEKKPFTLG
jgi:hypothetical protein